MTHGVIMELGWKPLDMVPYTLFEFGGEIVWDITGYRRLGNSFCDELRLLGYQEREILMRASTERLHCLPSSLNPCLLCLFTFIRNWHGHHGGCLGSHTRADGIGSSRRQGNCHIQIERRSDPYPQSNA
ncbi:hypothetical protein ACFOHY_04820 [Rhizobium rosettiformans]|uniref:hypothetical protein n=1 Tax=Rhizobium rosettiformans TaxID=1368430 RepID=UPI003609E365